MAPVKLAAGFLLSLAMAAIGQQPDLRRAPSAGVEPLAPGLFAPVFISLLKPAPDPADSLNGAVLHADGGPGDTPDFGVVELI